MQVYNVEVFDRNFLNIYHDQVSANKYVEDYIDMKKNSITCKTDEVVKDGDLISIYDGIRRYVGIIQSTDIGEELMTINYLPFYSFTNTQILFDTDLQGSGRSLESVIKDYILEYFVNNTDSNQNIPIIGNINLLSATTTWGFNLKSDKEGMHRCIINFYDVIIKRAFNQYAIVVECVPNLSNSTIDINIGVKPDPTFTIETNGQNVLSSSVMVGQLANTVNKLVVYNDADYTQQRIYYLHTDGTYSTTDTNRLMPVKEKLQGVSVSEGSTFPQVADSSAADVFSGAGFNNNITVEMLPDGYDTAPIGQRVNIIHNGITYESILSKKELADTCKLTFGCIRVNLTYLIKGGIING